MPKQERKIDPEELEAAKEALERIRDDLDLINTFFRQNVSRGEYERLKAYGLANAYIGLFEEHEWVARGEDSIEFTLNNIEADSDEEDEEDLDVEEECPEKDLVDIVESLEDESSDKEGL